MNFRDWVRGFVEVDIEVNSLYFGTTEESDNSWTSDTSFGVTIESTSVGTSSAKL